MPAPKEKIKYQQYIEKRRRQPKRYLIGNGLFNNPEWLYNEYVSKALKMKDIGEKCGADWTVIRKRLQVFNIPIRKRGFRKGHKLNVGKTSWCKGLTKENPRIAKIVLKTKGLKRTEKTKKILSELAKKRIGELANNWQGGKSDFKESIYANYRYEEWRKAVFERDGYVCQMCGYDEGSILQANHIKRVKEIIIDNDLRDTKGIINCVELWDTKNGITLCRYCHESIYLKEQEYAELFKNKVIQNSYAY